MTLNELETYAKKMIKLHSELQEDILDFVDLAKMEIKDGGSEWNECELAISDIKELINSLEKN
tara:strand:+ start:34 stop:222 length:189 start_codon:yes stop_codon:yes gene_type:complete